MEHLRIASDGRWNKGRYDDTLWNLEDNAIFVTLVGGSIFLTTVIIYVSSGPLEASFHNDVDVQRMLHVLRLAFFTIFGAYNCFIGAILAQLLLLSLGESRIAGLDHGTMLWHADLLPFPLICWMGTMLFLAYMISLAALICALSLVVVMRKIPGCRRCWDFWQAANRLRQWPTHETVREAIFGE